MSSCLYKYASITVQKGLQTLFLELKCVCFTAFSTAPQCRTIFLVVCLRPSEQVPPLATAGASLGE